MRFAILVMVGFTAALVLAFPGSATAQSEKGDTELQFTGLVNSTFTDGDDATNGTVFANIGYFVTADQQVGGGPTFRISAGRGTSVNLGLNFFYRYHFTTDNPLISPYVGAEYFIFDLAPAGDLSALDLSFINGIGGAKFYLSEKTAVDLKGAFGFGATSPSAAQVLAITVGLTYLF
ncbi:MAG: hypothetical protein FI707_01355 [SAR202 cluster bacterium]|jgi:hypothetical protein|nr:hypothetical protein [Acidobacteriota bacterium]MQG59670.1 hypothetical protein [SAR202 cluster bacterium]MQG67424.1 hypothetical protein [SAR202 cluster bacterium]HAL46359.1 hypothetical protein [Dehalococcoidia bacterium]|tara:strand:+ start:467 stop:997 length:531 start_codon:yes stop_codon:yes gene_type:complete